MADEKFPIEIDKKFIQNLFGLADMPVPANVALEELNNAVKIIKEKMDRLLLSQAGHDVSANKVSGTVNSDDSAEYLRGGEVDINKQRPRSVLIVDDLGIIIYQLEILFKKFGFDVTTSKELYEAIDKYKKKDFGYVILDLFIPTEREGFILLDEIKKLALFCKLNTKIIVMSASPKSEYKDKCLNRGADHYIEKTTGWQKNVMDICLGKSV